MYSSFEPKAIVHVRHTRIIGPLARNKQLDVFCLSFRLSVFLAVVMASLPLHVFFDEFQPWMTRIMGEPVPHEYDEVPPLVLDQTCYDLFVSQ